MISEGCELRVWRVLYMIYEEYRRNERLKSAQHNIVQSKKSVDRTIVLRQLADTHGTYQMRAFMTMRQTSVHYEHMNIVTI